MVFAGTMITNGYATALVTRTGMETEIGKIQQAVMEAKEEEEKKPISLITVLVAVRCSAHL